jgi:2-amino-4-hydroxy-6-hydroxymethyldihydropteridine diphosphokinase
VNAVLVGFGSNVGDRLAILGQARRTLSQTPGWAERSASSLYETQPVGGPPQGPYLNACVLFEADCSAREVLDRLHHVEMAAGRERCGRDHPRTLDLDLLLFGDEVIGEEDLQVPHPRMPDRGFVLAPASEIAPDMVHPTSGLTLGECARRLQPTEGVTLHGPSEMWA